MFNKKKRGFTLIELLVVIAIIGILASIVLVSLQGARNRARDARIIADMGQMRSASEVFYGNSNPQSYANLDTSADVTRLSSDIADQQGPGLAAFEMLLNGDGSGYCATVQMNTNAYWCVDSGLVSEQDADGVLTNCVAACESAYSCACD